MKYSKIHNIIFPVFLYLCINVLFVDKYTARITGWHWLCDLIYIIIGIGLLFFIRWRQRIDYNLSTLALICGCIYIVIMIAIQYSIDPMTLQVDRWSAINNFLDNLFQGVYPYSAQTHLGGYGSPFPVWQILHIPFFIIGNVGLSFFAVFILFMYTIVTCESPRVASLSLLLIAFSPAIMYEIIVRSDLFTNFLLVCTICMWLKHKHIEISTNTYLIALIVGLIASTRLAAVIPLAFLYGYAFLKLEWRKQIGFIVTLFIVFALTFLPFMLWDIGQLFFFKYNPFVLQTRQGSPFVLIVFALFAICWTIYKKNDTQQFELNAGGLLTLLVCITFVYNMISCGNYSLFSSQYDITYFNMALPFYICAMVKFLNPLSTSKTRHGFLDD